MAVKQLSAFAQIAIHSGAPTGQVQKYLFGFARDIGFVDPRRHNDNRPPEAEPGILYPVWNQYQTEFATSVNGLTLQKVQLPRDMKPEEWVIGPDPTLIRTIYPADALGLQHFWLNQIATGSGQNLWQEITKGGGASPAPVSAATGIGFSNATSFRSQWTLQQNQGWIYTEVRFHPASTEMFNPLATALLGIGNGQFTLIGLLVIVSEIAIIALVIIPFLTESTIISWGIGGSTGIVWSLIVPSSISKLTDTYLLKSVDGGLTFNIADTFPFERSQAPTFFGAYRMRIRFKMENGNGVIQFDGHERPWPFRDPETAAGMLSPDGQVDIHWNGTGGYWSFNALACLSSKVGGIVGVAISAPLAIDANTNADGADLSVRLVPNDGGVTGQPTIATQTKNDCVVTGTVHNETTDEETILGDPAGSYRLSLEWVETPSGAAKAGQVDPPIVFGVQEVRKAKLQLASSLVGDMAADALSIEWKLGRRYRGHTAKIRARNQTGQWSTLQGNELVTLSLAQITGDDATNYTATPTYYQQMQGLIASRKLRMDTANFPFTPGIIDISVVDIITARLMKKKMVDRCAYGGWDLQDALNYEMNRCGIDPAFYDFSGGAGVTLGNTAVKTSGRGHLSFKYNDTHGVLHAMDEMVASVGFEWGVLADGIMRCWAVGTYDLSHAYTLDDSTYDPDVDLLQYIETDQAVEQVYNICRVYAKDENGADQVDTRWDPDSIYSPGATNYVGDDWWDVFRGQPGTNPTQLANARLAQLGAFNLLVSWKTDLNLQLQPRQAVTVNVTGHNITPGTKLYVLDKTGRVEFSEDGFTGETEFLLGVPKKGAF